MADIRPFRALRYDPGRVRLEDVLTQPYDKISPEMQSEYYRRSPHNLVRFELARAEPGTDASQVYQQSAVFLSELQREGVLRLDETPSLYAYAQRFCDPRNPKLPLERMGLIALGRLYDYGEGVVFRHEQTLSGPKADRMNLLRAARAHSGQIFMLYEDAERHVESQLAAAIEGREPDARVLDEYGVENRLWRIADGDNIAELVSALADKNLIIADGHHRYETARAYRDAQREQGVSGTQPHDFAMMTLIGLDSPGLIVLPTHRVLFGFARLEWPRMRAGLAEHFELHPVKGAPAEWLKLLEQERGTAFLMATPAGAYLLRGISAAIERALPLLSPEELKVDVTVLHKLVLERAFGLAEEDIREQRHLRYFRDAQAACGELARGANAVFLLNAVPLPVLREVCYAGRTMPQKSTDFYPKLLSGLTLYHLDRSFESVQLAGIR